MKNTLTTLAVAAIVTACGGGGGNDSPSGASTAQGLYIGSTSTGRAVTGLVLSDGTTYVLYSSASSPSVIAGVVQGTVGTTASDFRDQDARDFNLEGFGVLAATVAGTYVTKRSVSGTIFYAKSSVAFTGTYSSDYELKPSLSTIAGSYSGQVASSAGTQTAAFTISSTGAVAGSSGGCAATGQFTPRADGNAYDTTVTFGAAPCLFAGQTLTGIAYFNVATKRLYAAAPNAARTDGVLFVGTKP
ncbi:MAG TPA: hypothetical protein VFA35_07995 [Burkholderiaceae bacterium]|nr:hypothetical protein [Burkholderiaceae bacterium]